MKRNSKILTVPNVLSMFRLVLIPVYVGLYINAQSDRDYLNAGIVLGISCITDLLDGWIARQFNQTSDLGKVLDPIADKLTQAVVLFCMADEHPILWWLLGLLTVKELVQLAAGYFYLKKGNSIRSSILPGKICTTVLFGSAILIMVFPGLPVYVVNILTSICIVCLVIALWEYIRIFCLGRPERKKKSGKSEN